jgi:hypothetical protein
MEDVPMMHSSDRTDDENMAGSLKEELNGEVSSRSHLFDAWCVVDYVLMLSCVRDGRLMERRTDRYD